MGYLKTITILFALLFWAVFYGAAQSAAEQEMFKPEVLAQPDRHRSYLEERIPISEIGIYTSRDEKQSVLLENGYAQHRFQNEDDWPLQEGKVRPTAIEIIFTKYPKDKAFWLTDYHWLLAKRLQALFALDPGLNNTDVNYKILLQTACENEFEAMQLFHGIRIRYAPLEANGKTERNEEIAVQERSDESLAEQPRASNNPTAKKVLRFMVRERHYIDSTVYNVLDRHPEWRRANLVLDWTGSMYGYGAEAILWHVLNEQRSGVEHVFFFNDGDRKKKRKKVPGFTGGIYQVAAQPATKPLKYFKKVQNKGNGGDSPENDVEAVIASIKAEPDAGAVILVADNGSCIRDFNLVECINRPIHIILCGTEKGINHQYINLALRTGGSLHTKTEDITNLNARIIDGKFNIDGVQYILTPDQLLVPTNRFQDDFGYCNRYYRYRYKGKRPKQKQQNAKCYFTE